MSQPTNYGDMTFAELKAIGDERGIAHQSSKAAYIAALEAHDLAADAAPGAEPEKPEPPADSPKKGKLLAFPSDLVAWYKECRQRQYVQHVVVDGESVAFDGPPDAPLFFGPPHMHPAGVPVYEEIKDQSTG